MGWVGVVVDVLIKILKGIFGTDKPQQVEVDHAKPDVPVLVRPDDDLLSELGVRPDPRPENKDGLHDSLSGEASGDSGAGQGQGKSS